MVERQDEAQFKPSAPVPSSAASGSMPVHLDEALAVKVNSLLRLFEVRLNAARPLASCVLRIGLG
jgi:hypothetical protein